jgi:F-type H+-transporting ATPase subunit epsilon
MELPTHIDLRIVTPERVLAHEQVDELQIPGAGGYFGVLPGHAPLIALLKVGELWYRKGQTKTYLAVSEGFAEILPERVTILARIAEKAEDIDIERAEAARQRAEQRLKEPGLNVDFQRARVSLARALVRIDVANSVGLRGVTRR